MRKKKEFNVEDIQGVSEDMKTRDIVKYYEEKIENLRIQESNLQAQLHQLMVKKEAEEKVSDVHNRIKFEDEQKKINLKLEECDKRMRTVELKELKIREREEGLSKREQELINIDKMRADLDKERHNFRAYKFDIEKKMEEAKIVIAEADAREEKLLMMKQALDARQRGLEKAEKKWNDDIGKLEMEKREFEKYKSSFDNSLVNL